MGKSDIVLGNLTQLQVSEALSRLGITLPELQIDQIREYVHLLLRWNATISLTSITDPIEIVGRHFGESMYAVPSLPVENCRLVDIGTGAGFPGLALKIAFPGIHLEMIESNKRKCAFLAEVVRVLGLSDVTIHCLRYEDIRPEKFCLDVITSRAVGDFKSIMRWSSRALDERGHLFLWLGAEDSTRVTSTSGWIWQPPILLPDSKRRFILIGRPLRKISVTR
jgi:16S rRNA (guanine527-N7)-methyltransferase